MFLAAMDMTANPCQDFYQFACGSWAKNNPIPPSASRIETFDILQNTVYQQVATAFEAMDPANASLPVSVKAGWQVYKQCNQAVNIPVEVNGTQFLLSDLGNRDGYWPIITPNWNASWPQSDPFTLMGYIEGFYGQPTLFTSGVDVDWGNVKQNAHYVDQATLTMPTIYYQSNYTKDSNQAQLIKLIYQTAMYMAQQANIIVNKTLVENDAMDIVNLEMQLAQISIPDTMRRNQSAQYNPVDYASISVTWPNLDISTYIKSLLSTVGLHPVMTNGRFISAVPSYLQQLNQMWPRLQANPRLLYNYLLWRMLFPNLNFFGETYRSFYRDFRRGVDQVQDLPPAALDCVDLVTAYMPYVTGRVYIDNQFNINTRYEISLMIENVLASFRGLLSGLPWMETRSKLTANGKITGLIRNPAYPDWILNNTLLDAYYSGFNPIPQTDSFWQVVSLLNYYAQVQNFGMLRLPGDRYAFQGSPATVNAWYQPERNSITFPAAILNAPFFRYDFPKAVNYGGMGVVMGHELTHGFDDQGVQFDATGALNTWLSMGAQQGFSDMAQCVVSEYGGFCRNFTSTGRICVNGVDTQGENIADNGGIRAAYMAYQSFVANNGPEARLPGLESMTMEQIFFLSFGNVWCRNITPDAQIRQLLLDPHSPGEERVRGTVQNFEPFGAAFGCQKGDPMYPANHCNVW